MRADLHLPTCQSLFLKKGFKALSESISWDEQSGSASFPHTSFGEMLTSPQAPWGDKPAAGTLEWIITPGRTGVLWCQEEKVTQSWAKSGVSKEVPRQL